MEHLNYFISDQVKQLNLIPSTWLNYTVLKSKHKICLIPHWASANNDLQITRIILSSFCAYSSKCSEFYRAIHFSNENIFIKLYLLLKAWKMLCVSDKRLFDLNSFCRLRVTSKRYQLLPFRFMFMFEYIFFFSFCFKIS